MTGKCIRRSEYLKLNNNYIILKISKSMVKVVDDTMEGVWYDRKFFEIKDCEICLDYKKCEDNHYNRKAYECMKNDYKDFK